MKTTLNLNDALLQTAKAFAAQQRISLTRLLEEGLQMRLRAAQGAATGRCRCAPPYRCTPGAAVWPLS